MDCLPLPMDIINKIQLYVSTPEADIIREAWDRECSYCNDECHPLRFDEFHTTEYADFGYSIVCGDCVDEVEAELEEKKKECMEDFLKEKIESDKIRLVELCEENDIPKYFGKIGVGYREWNLGRSAYTRFVKTLRTGTKEDNPEMSNGEILKLLAKAWKYMDDEDKDEWRSEEQQKHHKFLRYYESKNKLKEYVEELKDLATDEGILYEVMMWPFLSDDALFEKNDGKWISDNWDFYED